MRFAPQFSTVCPCNALLRINDHQNSHAETNMPVDNFSACSANDKEVI